MVLCLFITFVAGCSEEIPIEDLYGNWQHQHDRAGYDFSPEGVVAKWSLSPQSIELYRYRLAGHKIELKPVFEKNDEPNFLEFTLEGDTFKTEPKPGLFRVHHPSSLKREPVFLPKIVGLWVDDPDSPTSLLNFTKDGTVFGRVATKTEGEFDELWGYYIVEPSTKSISRNTQVLKIWGLKGNAVLSGKPSRIGIKKGQLRWKGRRFKRLSSLDGINDGV